MCKEDISMQRINCENETPLYQADVKGMLRSGRLIVYRDRVEFVVSQVQKMVFDYASLISVKKGLDRIHFITEDGRTESCAVNRKNIHEAFYVIEQAFKPYIARRNERLSSEGIRYSFPSSRSGLTGMLSGGVLDVMDDRVKYRMPSGDNETLYYKDVKAVRVSAVGMLEFSLYDGTKKAFSADKELRDEALSFLEAAVAPYVAERKAQLLAMGIYFSFPSSQDYDRGVLNILDDRIEYKAESGQTQIVEFQDVLAARASSGVLDVSLTDGTTKTFMIDKDARAEVLSFVEAAIAPYTTKRTIGFDTVFGLDEKIEFNEQRGVFHIIRQGGREISGEYRMQDLSRAESREGKISETVAGTLLGSITSAAGLGGAAGTSNGDERITDTGVLLTVRTEQGAEKIPVRFGSFSFGISKTSSGYGKYADELSGFFSYVGTHYPDCELILPVSTPDMERELTEAAAAKTGAEAVTEEGRTAAVFDRTVDKNQFGTLIDGISSFIGQCATPMTIAIQGDWESGKNSFMRMIYDDLTEKSQGNILWLNTWQFSQLDLTEQFPLLLADKLIKLLGASVNEETKDRAKLIAQGVIHIASGLISQGSTDGQKLTDAIFRENAASSLEQKVKLFADLVNRRIRTGNGKVIIFVDDLNRLTPTKAVGLLDALKYFFDCAGCVFVAAVDREIVIHGKKKLNGQNFSDEQGKAYFGKLFKTTFRVPLGSFDIRKYMADNLSRVNIHTADTAEINHYVELAVRSVGRDPKLLEHLFNSFLFLKSLTGEEACTSKERRLTLFALLCMQSEFPGVYDYMVRMKNKITPDFLNGLSDSESAALALTVPSEDEKTRFRDFAKELCESISTDGTDGISYEECRAFVEALTISAAVSSK